MFVTGVGNSNVREYVPTGFDVSTSSFTQTLVTSGKDNDNFGPDFNNDGTKMYITGTQMTKFTNIICRLCLIYSNSNI